MMSDNERFLNVDNDISETFAGIIRIQGYKNIFFHMLDTALFNAYILYSKLLTSINLI